jgi:hypothetical protein
MGINRRENSIKEADKPPSCVESDSNGKQNHTANITNNK